MGPTLRAWPDAASRQRACGDGGGQQAGSDERAQVAIAHEPCQPKQQCGGQDR